MSKGVLLYSFNNEHTDYSRLTQRCIEHIKYHLDLPITVVGDRHFDGVNNVLVQPTKGNQRFYNDISVDWFNLERVRALDYSPYDITILMDTDYFVMSKQLLELSNSANDILIHNKVYDITHQNNLCDLRDCVIPMVWATVIIFKKTLLTESVFAMVKHIQRHYYHYRNLYRVRFPSYRNDYAFAIALHQIYGQDTNAYSIPHPMFMSGLGADVIDLSMTNLIYKWKKNFCELSNQDVHVFNKDFLQ